ncbi:MAG: DMT family transporter [Rikenellaceae bacterium]|nr:DMT family transporter [Rikenellaceae bacterium]
MTTGRDLKYHIMALFTVTVWGTTFVSTKILLSYGLTPAEIMLYRFFIAYILIWFVSPRKLFCDSRKDELLMLGAGMGGGSMYFLTENLALKITLASNVSLIICTAPLFASIFIHFFGKGEHFGQRLLAGSFIALAGVALVVFNGSVILKISPLGDLLTLIAALSWATYTLIIRSLGGRYNTAFITRKVFFYGLLTLSPVFLFTPLRFDPAVMAEPVVWINILFLGVIASMLCFIIWNIALKNLGGIRTSNYIYLTPIVTLIASSLIINEQITGFAVMGALMILLGVYVAEKPLPEFFRNNR